jgi:hypothetical protein
MVYEKKYIKVMMRWHSTTSKKIVLVRLLGPGLKQEIAL